MTLLAGLIVLTWLAAIVAGALAVTWIYRRFGE
jgi:hypothetical protein